MVDRVESNSKLANFEGIFCFHTLLQVLNTLPVFVLENGIIVGQQTGALEPGQLWLNQRLCPVASVVEVEVYSTCTSIIGILDNFLRV